METWWGLSDFAYIGDVHETEEERVLCVDFGGTYESGTRKAVGVETTASECGQCTCSSKDAGGMGMSF